MFTTVSMTHMAIWMVIAVFDVLLNADEMATIDMRHHMYQCNPGSVILSVCDTTGQKIDASKVNTVTQILSSKSSKTPSVNKISPSKIKNDHVANHRSVFT
jgi:hypothetical protein